jgi:tetratricopeptide (TPR) repeat protein
MFRPRFAMMLLLATAQLPLAALAAGTADYQALTLWCIDREDKNRPKGKKLPEPPPGYDYFHFHHFCYGQIALNKSYVAKSKLDKQYQLDRVIGETNYVLSHVAAGHPLLPEVHLLRGQSYFLGNKLPNAENALLKALQLDPGHLEAHLALARLYVETQRKDKAIKTVRAGLALMPSHKALRRMGDKLGIELPALEAKPEVMPEAKPGVGPVATPATPPKTEPASVEPVPAEPAHTETAASPSATPIGSPTNPWCRFCPDTSAAPPASSPSMPGVVPKDWK